MNFFKRNATKVFLFILAAYPCIHPVPSAAATMDDPGHRSKCSVKYKDPEGIIYLGGSFSEDCSTVEILPVRSELVEAVNVKTLNPQLCEEYEIEAARVETFYKQLESDLDLNDKLSAEWIQSIQNGDTPEQIRAARDRFLAHSQKTQDDFKKLEELHQHRQYLAGIPVMRALFNIRSTAEIGYENLRKANPGLRVIPAKIWDLAIVHPKLDADLKSLPSLIGANGPTKNVSQERLENEGVPVELVLSRSGACVYYDKVTKTFDTEKAATKLKEHFPVMLQFKAESNGEVKTLGRLVSQPRVPEREAQLASPLWIMDHLKN